ncbi:U2 small nuclear ribonucleoprotein A' [Folsomia candida]|uniref:U2 small nuclear ribonucleoprotein A' n=1 Tax=Folsomia candida TaxID=158441 RepID=UPI000B8F9283|nr:U2 small nuclear ribonucleoprotein A' [Folsomia candida]
MVKLTPDLINNCIQRINPIRDRELNLRGLKIPMIENLGATLNQFDTIDFSDNDIRKLDNFPLLPRLKNIILNNNRVVRISPTLHEVIPSLESLVLTNNMLQDLGEIDNLSKLQHLTHLTLLFSPVSTKEFFRQYVIFRLPQLKVLDFKKITMKERDEAKAFFKSKRGKEIRKEIATNRSTDEEFVEDDDEEATSVSNGIALKSSHKAVRRGQLLAENTSEVNEKIKEAIRNATSLEEIERLNQVLKSGQIPQFMTGSTTITETLATAAGGEVEEMEDN